MTHVPSVHVSCPSATMVVWISAWLNGSVAADDVLDALLPWGEAQEVFADDEETGEFLDLPTTAGAPTSIAMLLACLRRAGAGTGRVVLPIAGDVRGLGSNGRFPSAALRAGEAAVFGSASIGAVPERVAEGILRWTVFRLPYLPPAEYVPIGEAEHDMASAVREAAAALAAMDVAKHQPGVREEINAELSANTRAPWPGGIPQRAVRVLRRAAEVEAILHAANADPVGNAVSASSARARTDMLRPLGNKVRTAIQAAVDEAVRALSGRADWA